MEGIFLVSVQWGKANPVLSGVNPGLVVLDSIIKQAEEAMEPS